MHQTRAWLRRNSNCPSWECQLLFVTIDSFPGQLLSFDFGYDIFSSLVNSQPAAWSLFAACSPNSFAVLRRWVWSILKNQVSRLTKSRTYHSRHVSGTATVHYFRRKQMVRSGGVGNCVLALSVFSIWHGVFSCTCFCGLSVDPKVVNSQATARRSEILCDLFFFECLSARRILPFRLYVSETRFCYCSLMYSLSFIRVVPHCRFSVNYLNPVLSPRLEVHRVEAAQHNKCSHSLDFDPYVAALTGHSRPWFRLVGEWCCALINCKRDTIIRMWVPDVFGETAFKNHVSPALCSRGRWIKCSWARGRGGRLIKSLIAVASAGIVAARCSLK